MDGFQAGIHALLQDIDSDYGKNEKEQYPLPYSRPNLNTYQPHIAQPTYSRQTSAPIYDKQQLSTAMPMTLPEIDHYQPREDISLDKFDLLAEPLIPSWQLRDGMNGGPARRLTLPSHTTTPSDPFEQRKPKSSHHVLPSPQIFRSQLAQYVHTPPAQMHHSSPSNGPPSSPSFKVKQRRIAHATRPSAASATASPSYLPSEDRCNSTRRRSLQVSQGNKAPPQPPISSSTHPQPPIYQQIVLNHAPPIVQGVQLVSLNHLPDRLRSVFRHPLFNAIQSKCFPIAYESNDNLVVSAPTGGGKTAILEMAICRLVAGFKTDQYKIVYMAPTKSLCSERQRDWQAKFAALDLQCAELTGDTEHGQLRKVQSASIVITTPEKWDSMTRKWKDHARLMQMVKLFLIDEVHILKDTRGATLEAVVSRMKSVGSNVRFIALSATVPNSEDIAKWLGKDPTNPHMPAQRERFGEEFRPVRLQKHVVGLPYRGNDFGFEAACDPKLPAIVSKYSQKKPIMVFCITRNATVSTAKILANTWASKGPRERQWEGPTQKIAAQDLELRKTLTSGVAFHHAGLDGCDRHAIERGFLEGQINVICCTSTLAVGVNLPCHMVIIKNTMSWSDDGLKEYADLEIMQMLGRAGRPQFDTTAVAVIITKQEKVTKYERLVSGEELLESCLHLNLIDHLNAEIGLGTIYDLYTAKRWLGGTFLHVRLGQNPEHYKLDGGATDLDLDDRIECVCKRDLALLETSGLINSKDGRLKATELGDAMARYYVEYETMQVFLRLQPRAKLSDILSAVVQAKEFHGIRLKSYEKKLYKQINGANGIKFPIKVDLAMHAHKRSLILQAELGGVEFPPDEQYAKHKRQFNQDKAMLFSHIHRLIHCVIDCQLYLQDAVAVRHALELARSFSARVWDNSPYQLKQIAQIGLVAIRKLATAGINSIEALEAAEPHQIEMHLSRNPPFGQKLLENLVDFPKLRVSVKLMGKEAGRGLPVKIKIKAECGFMNEKVPVTFHRKQLYICLLTERSDGQLVDFKRISARNLNKGKDFLMSAELLSHTQYITSYVMCDSVAGTIRHAELKPDLPAHLFPPLQPERRGPVNTQRNSGHNEGAQRDGGPSTSPVTLENDEFGECEIEDQDMVDVVAGVDFRHVDNIATGSLGRKSRSNPQEQKVANAEGNVWNPERLDNGKWACNHKCKDKTTCKHMCCREGVDKAPKAPKSAFVSAGSLVDASMLPGRKDTHPPLPSKGKAIPSKTNAREDQSKIETLDLAHDPYIGTRTQSTSSRELQSLQRLHDSVVKGPATPVIARRRHSHECDKQGRPQLPARTRNKPVTNTDDGLSTDYDGDWMSGLPSPTALLGKDSESGEQFLRESANCFNGERDGCPFPLDRPRKSAVTTQDQFDDDSLEDFDLSQFNQDDERSDLEAAMVGLSDSITMNEDSQVPVALNGGYQDKAVAERLPPKDRHFASPASLPARNDSNASSKLFLSTDSPEKLVDGPDKGPEVIVSEANEAEDSLSLSAPAPKRQRMCGQADAALQPSWRTAHQVAPAAATIKPGQPAWVYEFDPAFIAEWQDFVDFV